MHKPRPVIAVIPHYNMQENLARLLPGVIAEYDHTVVIDDASSDPQKLENVLSPFKDAVHFLQNPKNLGAGLTRNAIFQLEDKLNLGGALIHFIDADGELVSRDNPSLIRELFNNPRVGVAGGLVLDSYGTAIKLNFGRRGIRGYFAQQYSYWHYQRHGKTGKQLPGWVGRRVYLYPNPYGIPPPQRVSWLIEQSLIMPYQLFKEIGGFRPIRYHDIQAIVIELKRHGYEAWFEPSIVIRNHDLGIHPQRRKERRQANKYLRQKYGLAWQFKR